MAVGKANSWSFLAGGGDMAAHVKRHDWTATSLGPPDDWPQGLKTLVTVMLGSSEPMFVAWGPDRTLIYNDAYSSVLANKHPALGQDFLAVWPEIRAELEPLVAKAYLGQPSRTDDIELVMHRKGYPEVTHWTYSYTPIHDENGVVNGFFCPCHEITAQVLATRIQAFRAAFEKRIGGQTDARDVMTAAVDLLGRELGANRVGYGEVQADDATVVLHSCYADGIAPLSGPFPLDGFGSDNIARQRQGLTEAVADIRDDPKQDAAVWAAIDTRAFASVPLIRDGRFTASLYVNFRAPHVWAVHEIALIEEVAARTWSAVERARAEGRLHESERRLRALVNATSYSVYRMSPDWQEMRQLDGRGFLTDTSAPSIRWLDLYIDPADRPQVLEAIDDAIRHKKMFELEHRIRRLDGSLGWTHSRAVPIHDESGGVIEWFGAASDVTDRTRVERLRAMQNRVLELAIEDRSLPDALDQLVQTVENLSDSRMVASVLLFDRDNSCLRHGAAPNLPDAYNAAIDGIIVGEGVGSCGTAAARREPVYVADVSVDPLWADFRDLALAHGLGACWSTPILSAQGDVLGTFAMYYHQPRSPGAADLELIDFVARSAALVIERKRAEAALREREEQLRLATDAAEIGFWDVDTVNERLFWPPRVKVMFGISPELSVSMADFYAGLHPGDRDAVTDAFAAACDPELRALYDVEYRTVGKEDGVVRWVAAKGRGHFDQAGVCVRVTGTAIDITERRREAERLRASEAALTETAATLDASIGYAPIGFAFFDRQHRYVRVNETLAAINGIPAAAHVGRNIAEVVPANAEAVDPVIARVFVTGEPIPAFEVEGETSASPGERRAWLTSLFPVFDAEGETMFVGVTVIDITDRKRAENSLAALNETLERRVAAASAERDAAWSNARDLLVVINTQGMFQAVNPAWTTILGWTPDELIGRSVFDFILPEDQEVTIAALTTAAAGPLPGVENRYRHKIGGHRWISWVAAPQGEQIYANGRDVTEEKARDAELAAAQDALRQAQKMDAVGQLTGGIAHDFNNLLQGVAGSLDLIRRKPDDIGRVRRWAEAGLQAAERGAKLTGQLLAFSRAQKLESKPLRVPDLVNAMRELLERTLGPEIRIIYDLDETCVPVLSDATQLEMAVLNLAINARDAMDGVGELTITARKQHVSGDAELEAGEYVELSVSDTGPGMPPEIIARAFDPFFTTKDVGKGTGLGLSQVYGIARQAGGTARIESRLGRGTAVRLYLRRTDRQTVDTVEEEVGALTVGRSATVLVIDDDADVRRFLIDSLDALGFRAQAAQDGAEGLRAVDHTSPDVLIVDYAMPGMNGAEVFRAVRQRRPDLPIIFASGYANTSAIEEVAGRNTPILRKPFRVDELKAVISEALNGRE